MYAVIWPGACIIKVSNKRGVFLLFYFVVVVLVEVVVTGKEKGKVLDSFFSFLKNHDCCLQKVVRQSANLFCTGVKPLIFSLFPLDITAQKESGLLFAFLQYVFFLTSFEVIF